MQTFGGYSQHDNGNIVIHGGTIEANGYDHCAGIGTNDSRTGGAISVYGGTITAIGGSDGADAFDGCEKVYIFGTVGSSAERYCRNHSNCVFVAETQN